MERLLTKQGHRLIQLGAVLLIVVLLEGFVIALLGSPRLALSAHNLGALQSVLLLALGVIWPRLALGDIAAKAAFGLFIYSSFAILLAYVLAAWWGAGNETMPLAAGRTHGSAAQEAVIRFVAFSSAPTGQISFALMLWGLRIRRGWPSHQP